MGKNETIERKQLVPIIADYIKACAARMGERNSLQLAIRHTDWGNRINGVWRWSSSEITVGDDKYTIRDRQVTDPYFLTVVENALKESGVKGKIFTEPQWVGADKFSRLEIYTPPCQEFNRLNDLLKRLTRKTLADTDIYGVHICGKRSSYSDSGDYRYLCYNKENCKNIADLITAVCDDKDTLHFKVEEFLDHGDEGDYRAAQYHESEWYGSRGQNLHIIVKDQNGKEKFNDVCTFAECPDVPRELVREKIKARNDIPKMMRVKPSFSISELNDGYSVEFKDKSLDLFGDTDIHSMIDAYGGQTIRDLNHLYVKFYKHGTAERFAQRVSLLIEERKGEVSDLLRDKLVACMRKAGIKVSYDVEEGERLINEQRNSIKQLSKAQKRALETASVSQREKHHPTVVSSDHGAKILNNLEILAKDFENLSNQSKFFIGRLAEKLEAEKDGSNSEYATFKTINNNIVTIRLADHNATVSNFDYRNEYNGISIVIDPKKNNNNGIINDGDAHIVEYYYEALDIRKSPEKPLVDIIRSIQQALYSGEYKDTTGLAVREEVNIKNICINQKTFKTSDGEVFGYIFNNNIYIDPRIATAETPIHEYAHLWAEALRQQNPDEWENVVSIMKSQTEFWNKVKKDYPHLETDDEIADEVLATYSGQHGMDRLRKESRNYKDGDTILQHIKTAIERFWKGVSDFFCITYKDAEEVADRVLFDLLNEVNPLDYTKEGVQKLSDRMILGHNIFEQTEQSEAKEHLIQNAKQVIHDRIVTPSARRFTPEQVEVLNRYHHVVVPDNPAGEVFKELLHEVAQESDVDRKPEKWVTDTAKELTDLAEGITRDQGQGLRR